MNVTLSMAVTSVFALLVSVTRLVSQTQMYTLVDIDPTSAYSLVEANAINANGEVAGDFLLAGSPIRHAFLYKNGTMSDIGTFQGYQSMANGINDVGQVVGNLKVEGGIGRAFLYSNGSMVMLDTLGGSGNSAMAINNYGQIAGSSQLAGNNSSHACIYENGSILDLGTLGGTNSTAFAINDHGEVVGYSDLSNGSSKAFLYSNGSIKKLDGLENPSGINNLGQVLGYSYISDPVLTIFHSFLYENGTVRDLDNAGTQGFANGINDSDQIVGVSFVGQTSEARLYSNGSWKYLKDLSIVNGTGWTFYSANAINNRGQIVGNGKNPSGQGHAFLLNPIPIGAVETVSNAKPAQPTYGNLPVKDPTKDSLVVVTHGWQPFPFPPDIGWVDKMSSNIDTYLSNHMINNWQVYGHKWVDGAWKLDPSDALVNAIKEGKTLGESIVAQGWTHVHFIAHSAGAALIQTATDVIKKPGSASFSTVVHETFLDAFVGSNFAGITTYGRGADWADSYFTRDGQTEIDPFVSLFVIAPYTESPVFHSYNVDVTFLDPHKSSYAKFVSLASGDQIIETCHDTETTHGWPIDFYTNTIVGNVTSNYAGFGFPLSEEGGKWDSRSEYVTGNGTDIHRDIPTQILGIPDSVCGAIAQLNPQAYPDTPIDIAQASSADSQTGSLQKRSGSVALYSGSPVWTAMFVSSTNPVNFVSFDAEFTDTNSAQGLLSVYWDTNTIGTLDERVVLSEFQHYLFKFPNAAPNSLHMLGFRLDPFTVAHSSILLTNIVLNQVGVSRPFSLSVTTNMVNGLRLLRLDGEAGFNYNVQASSNLASTNWTQIAILANTNGTVFFYDRDSTNYLQRFYRAVVP